MDRRSARRDPVVAAQLEGRLARLGGAAHLRTLGAATPPNYTGSSQSALSSVEFTICGSLQSELHRCVHRWPGKWCRHPGVVGKCDAGCSLEFWTA